MSYTFEYTSYNLDEQNKLIFTYAYRNGDAVIKEFNEHFTLPQDMLIDVTDPAIQKILQHVHIIVGISYYKSLRGNVAHTYNITPAQAAYYNAIYDKGLGEYKYINKLTEAIRPFTANNTTNTTPVNLQTNGAILGIGGGKDSIVAGELLKTLDMPIRTLDMATRDNHGQAQAVMEIMNVPQVHIGRYIDTSITSFTREHDGQNGHVPLSTIIAWLGVLIAYCTKTRYVAMANEGATSTGNTVWNGQEVNHQWAKSFESEQLTQQFVLSEISPDIVYVSPIRPYGSLVIMELLARLGKHYLQDFTSCNLVLRIDPASRPNGRWCTRCAKCLSTWLLLSYWLPESELVLIFGRNLWQDETLRENLEALLGLSGHKPLDCVGTIEELRAVTRRAILSSDNYPLLSGIAASDVAGPEINELLEERFAHNIPASLANAIEESVTKLL